MTIEDATTETTSTTTMSIHSQVSKLVLALIQLFSLNTASYLQDYCGLENTIALLNKANKGPRK